MRNGFLSTARIVLPCAAILSLGCQSPWQSGAPATTGGGWFSWMSVSERTSDPLTRLAGGGAYGPGAAEADANANGSRQQLYGARTSELNLSRENAQQPEGAQAPTGTVAAQPSQPKTLDQALPSPEDDVASRVARALQSRQTGGAVPALATGTNPTEGYDAAIAPAGYQAPAGNQPSAPTSLSPAPSTPLAPRTYVGTAPPDSESNPFYDPFGEGSSSATAANSPSGVAAPSAFGSQPSSSKSGSAALRLLTTPQASEPPAPTLTYPSGSTSAAPTGSLLRLLGDNPLRKDAPAPSGN
ncbi:MAG TPA: hypothetical protein VGN57_11145 [Pirellulaceae bacterium]|jgi:hypothetical protein|nr:hypothetical protein [Pirellulaceae bacterium]